MTPRVKQLAIALLAQRRLSKNDLATIAPCHQRTAQRVLKSLHDSDAVKIVAWESVYQQQVPVYGYGAKDVRKPRAVTDAERKRRDRRDPEFYMDEREARQKRRLVK